MLKKPVIPIRRQVRPLRGQPPPALRATSPTLCVREDHMPWGLWTWPATWAVLFADLPEVAHGAGIGGGDQRGVGLQRS